jgi:purine-binding chemotaxis protein CheW
MLITSGEGKMSELNHTIPGQIVIFTLDGLNYALPLQSVLRVIHAVEITFLPNAPEIIPGVINVQGRIIPVIDIRKRFGLPEREIGLEDRMIIADTGKRQVVLSADTVPGFIELSDRQMVVTSDLLQFGGNLKGIAKMEDGLILIYDLEKFLSLDEEYALEQAIKSRKQ